MYEIRITKHASRQLKKLSNKARSKILAAIDSLKGDPRNEKTKALKGAITGYRRVRAGAYRAIYTIEEPIVTVTVIEVGHRRNVYTLFR